MIIRSVFLAIAIFIFLSLPVLSQVPVISQVSPSSAAMGATVTLTSTNFNPVASSNIVYFGAVKAAVTGATANSITVTVPPGASYAPVTLSTANLTAYSSAPFTPVYPLSNPASTAALRSVPAISTLYQPESIYASDMDGDGKADLVTVSGVEKKIAIVPNISSGAGNISFGYRYAAGTASMGQGMKLTVADLDADGKQDIIAANLPGRSIVIFRNTSVPGSISLGTAIEIATTNAPYAVVARDFDGDGKVDIAAVTQSAVIVLKNIGTAGTLSFAPATSFPGGIKANFITAGDLDTDGKPDIVVTDSVGRVIVYHNTGGNGAISFDLPVNYFTGAAPVYVSVGDLNGDGKPELVTANYNDSTSSVFNNNSTPGNVSFDPKTDIVTGYRTVAAVICNVNGDSKPDLILGKNNSRNLQVFQNSTVGAGNNADFTRVLSPGVINFSSSIVSCDLDNDGKPDIASTDLQSSSISVFRNIQDEVRITSFSPTAGSTGTMVSIRGVHFTGVTLVKFGSSAAASFTVVSDTLINAIVANGATGAVSVSSPDGTASLQTFTFGPRPVITSFTPQSAKPGAVVSIKGSGIYFGAATSVSFGGIPARSYTNVSDSIINAVVDWGASGAVKISTVIGTDSVGGFTFLSPPVIDTFYPDTAFAGTTVTIKGRFFSGVTSARFGSFAAASFSVLSDTVMIAVTGAGASGSISVTTSNGTGSLPGFTYRGPVISRFYPLTGGSGTRITIIGENFTGVTVVSFGGIPAASFILVSPIEISAITGAGGSGAVSVTTPDGISMQAGFIAPPAITSFSPTAGAPGTVVTITGNSFIPDTTANIVHFGNARARVTSATSSSLTAIAPGSGYLPLSVTCNQLSSKSSQHFTTLYPGAAFNKTYFAMGYAPGFPVGDQAEMAVGDLNNDGNPDFVTADYDAVRITLGNSSGGDLVLGPRTHLDVNSYYSIVSLALADFNGDGRPDIAVGTDAGDLIFVYINNSVNGNLSFAPRFPIQSSATQSYLLAGDFDGDGRADLAAISYRSPTIYFMRNISSGGVTDFGARISFTLAATPSAAYISDLDHDGKPDLLMVTEAAAKISVLRNTGSTGQFSFAPQVDLLTGASPRRMGIGDLDEDGDLDLAVPNYAPATISIFKNHSVPGLISFDVKSDFPTRTGPTAITVNDMNGDGHPELIMSCSGNSTVNLLKNISSPGNIAFDTAAVYYAPAGLQYAITGDFNGDQKPDIMGLNVGDPVFIRNKFNEGPVIRAFTPTVAGAGDTVMISGINFTGASRVTFGGVPANAFKLLADSSIMAFPDAANSGPIEVITPDGTASSAGFTFLNRPVITSVLPLSGAVGSVVTISGQNFSPIPSDNMVSFGTARAQVVAASTNSLSVVVPAGATQQQVSVLVNERTGYYWQAFTVTFPGAEPVFSTSNFDSTTRFNLTATSGTGTITSAYLDADSKPDLFVSFLNSPSQDMATLRNIGTGPSILYGPQNLLTGRLFSTKVLVKDMNGDGKPDAIVGTGYSDRSAVIYKNTSTSTSISFGADTLSVYNSGVDNNRPYSADFDGDGRPDLVLQSEYTAGIVAVFRNISRNGNLAFGPQTIIGFANNDFSIKVEVLIEDFNSDGRPDIALTFNNEIDIFRNIGAIGSIEFAPKIRFITAAGHSRVAVAADFDGDGMVDIAKANGVSYNVEVWRNSGVNGNISFASPALYPIGYIAGALAAADMDGDGKPELITADPDGGQNYMCILKNTSSPGTLGFAAKVIISQITKPGVFVITDANSDGKPDIVSTNSMNNGVEIVRNFIGDSMPVILCPPLANGSIKSNLIGSLGQWQLNTGNGFANISPNANYGRTDSSVLQLFNIPSGWYGYQYRCLANGAISYTFFLKFASVWNGLAGSNWEDPANWSCNSVPDANTDVTINSGGVVIHSNTTIRSLKLMPAASLTIASGYTLTVLH